jgi:hypothetical protein
MFSFHEFFRNRRGSVRQRFIDLKTRYQCNSDAFLCKIDGNLTASFARTHQNGFTYSILISVTDQPLCRSKAVRDPKLAKSTPYSITTTAGHLNGFGDETATTGSGRCCIVEVRSAGGEHEHLIGQRPQADGRRSVNDEPSASDARRDSFFHQQTTPFRLRDAYKPVKLHLIKLRSHHCTARCDSTKLLSCRVESDLVSDHATSGGATAVKSQLDWSATDVVGKSASFERLKFSRVVVELNFVGWRNRAYDETQVNGTKSRNVGVPTDCQNKSNRVELSCNSDRVTRACARAHARERAQS